MGREIWNRLYSRSNETKYVSSNVHFKCCYETKPEEELQNTRKKNWEKKNWLMRVSGGWRTHREQIYIREMDEERSKSVSV